MNHVDLTPEKHIKSSSEYSQCTILWRNLPAIFKARWRSEAERLSTTGYKLFIETNINKLKTGDDIKIAPWH